jgi:7-carboxy-7-deazaguanine synthase
MSEHPWQLKFVVDAPADLAEIESYLALLPSVDRSRVLLMPQGIDQADLAAKGVWLAELCREHELGFCPRKHIEWFGNGRGT